MIIEHFLSWMKTAPVPKRAQAVSALARAYLYSEMTYDDRCAAESAMTILLEDPSSTVRFALADALASSKNAPRHVIMGLATDTSEIATLILARSPIFSDGELVDMVAGGTVEQQIAIACRGHISSAICGAIGEVGVVEACLGLLMNKAAQYSRRVVHRIAQRHGENLEIRKLLLSNDNLDAEVRMMLIDKLGEKLGNFVSSKNWLSKSRANKSISDTLDRCSILCAAKSSEPQVEQLVEALIASHRLTTAYLLRAICMGNITLFCKALSRLSAVPSQRIEAMISQRRNSAFRAAFVKSGMPIEAFDIFSTALNVWQDVLSKPEWISRARMPYLVTRQVIDKYQSNRNEVVDELLQLLQGISSDLAREEARNHMLELANKGAGMESASSKIQPSPTINVDANAGTNIYANVEVKTAAEIQKIDDQFTREIEASIAQVLEEDIINISENDMLIPDSAANDAILSKYLTDENAQREQTRQKPSTGKTPAISSISDAA